MLLLIAFYFVLVRTSHLLTYSSISEMDSMKNKQATKNRQEEIKKVAVLRAQGRGSSVLPPYVSKKRKHASNVQSSGKGGSGSSTRSETCEVIADALHHGVRKGLMTSQDLIVPPPLPLLVKDKEYAVDIACSIVQDADLDECLEYETDPLGDSGLYDMMRVCCIFIPFVPLHGFVPLFLFICPFL